MIFGRPPLVQHLLVHLTGVQWLFSWLLRKGLNSLIPYVAYSFPGILSGGDLCFVVRLLNRVLGRAVHSVYSQIPFRRQLLTRIILYGADPSGYRGLQPLIYWWEFPLLPGAVSFLCFLVFLFHLSLIVPHLCLFGILDALALVFVFFFSKISGWPELISDTGESYLAVHRYPFNWLLVFHPSFRSGVTSE